MPSEMPALSHSRNAPIASQKVTGTALPMIDVTSSCRVNE